jgi:signal transduction histidine kinase/CheY-like chemotaxis protein
MSQRRSNTVLVVDDDQLTRMMAARVMIKRGYNVVEASNGLEALQVFEDYYPDVILMDAMMPKLDGISACERLQKLPGGSETPIVMITALDDAETVNRAFNAGATDYITKPINWAVLMRRVERILRTMEAEEALQSRLAQLDILRRIDRELGYTLDLGFVLDMATDSALRWSGAMACAVTWLERETQKLIILKDLGQPQYIEDTMTSDQLAKDTSLVGRVFAEQATVHQVHESTQTADIIFPLRVRGQVNGFILLENFASDLLEDDSTLPFLEQLADRTAAAIDKATTYDQTQEHATQVDILYNIVAAMSGTLEYETVIDLLSDGLRRLLRATSSFYCTFEARQRQLKVVGRYIAPTEDGSLPDSPPPINTMFPLDDATLLNSAPVQSIIAQSSIPDAWQALMTADSTAQSSLIVPITYENNQFGVLVVNNSRTARVYPSADINLIRSLATQGATTLQQVAYLENIKELEQIKTEMIRMASHDLRNPLGQVTAYFEMLIDDISMQLNTRHQRYVSRIVKATATIESLLGDILNLENIESQTTANFEATDIVHITHDVIRSMKDQAGQKLQTYNHQIDVESAVVRGSSSQLKQAVTNLVGNAIKYTPASGQITINAHLSQGEFHFSVTDTGYGIPKDQQDRLFQHFYRARSATTEHIDGTGLGLSLVKSVIERHDGNVWFESVEGEGSTFGFWLPLMSTSDAPTAASSTTADNDPDNNALAEATDSS